MKVRGVTIFLHIIYGPLAGDSRAFLRGLRHSRHARPPMSRSRHFFPLLAADGCGYSELRGVRDDQIIGFGGCVRDFCEYFRGNFREEGGVVLRASRESVNWITIAIARERYFVVANGQERFRLEKLRFSVTRKKRDT